ncbi:MAG: hypothetical protein ACREQT_04250, partial [Candidatus Binataceae bacterium]
VRQSRREAAAAQESAERNAALGKEHGFADALVYTNIQYGWSIAKQRRSDEGIELIRQGLAALGATGTNLGRPYWLSHLADIYLDKGRFAEGLDVVAEALTLGEQNEDLQLAAELQRLRGELLHRRDESGITEARKCFERAVEIARGQGAKSFELRATTSLARLLASQGRRDEARAMLSEIYNWFTEGFDTVDLKEAKALLDELRR